MNAAQQIVRRAKVRADARLSDEQATVGHSWSDWTDADAQRRYISVQRSFAVWAKNSRAVAVSVASTPDGRTWSYYASEILDMAAADFDLPDSALISQVSPYSYVLTW